MKTNEELQKAGQDGVAVFDWHDEPVVVDEKAQSSDKCLNNPSPTFIMEIFGESWFDDGDLQVSTGWFVAEDNETEYYVLGWLPDVSLYKITVGIGEHPFLVYRPASAVDFEANWSPTLAETVKKVITNDGHTEYRMVLSPEAQAELKQAGAHIPTCLTSGRTAEYGSWYYGQENIHEAKVLIVEKAKVKAAFVNAGLSPEVLIEKGYEVLETGRPLPIEADVATKVMRAGDSGSGAGDGENPVFAVVPYQIYHDLASRTYHYQEGKWEEGDGLF